MQSPLVDALRWMAAIICWQMFISDPSVDCAQAQSRQDESLKTQSLHTVSGIELDARLVDFAEAGWEFRNAKDDVLRRDTLIRWGARQGVIGEQALWMADGSWLSGDLELDRRQATVFSDWFEELTVPLTSIRGVVIHPPATLEAWCELRRQMQSAKGGQDQLWLRDGNRVAGVLKLSPGTENEMKAVLEREGERFELSQDQIQSIVFSPALLGPLPKRRVDAESSVLEIGLRDGTCLQVANLHRQSDHVSLKLQNGQQLNSLDPPQDFVEAVSYLAGHDPRVTSLTELEPARYKHITENSLQWQLGIRSDVYGRPLMLPAGVVEDGLALHSSSQVAYRWDGSSASFQAEIVFAMPTMGGDPRLGSVDCRVLIVRDGQLQTVADVPLRRTGPAEMQRSAINVNISGAQLLVLLVEDADLSSYGDHVLWLNARIVRATP